MSSQPAPVSTSVKGRYRARARRFALMALPVALMTEPWVAAGLVVGIGLASNDSAERGGKALRVVAREWSVPVMGVLVAGLLAAASATAAGAGTVPVATWAAWLGAAAALMILTSRLGPNDAPAVTAGAALAAFTALAMALRQTIWLGESQAHLFAFHPNLAAAAMLVVTAGLLVGWRSSWRRSSLVGRSLLVLGLVAALVTVVLTGSRSGIVALAAGTAVWLALALPRARPRPLFFVAIGITFALVATWLVDRSLAGPATPNLIVNSGFEYGLTPWTTGEASERVESDEGFALHLVRPTASTWRFASYVPSIRADEGATFRMAVSVHPTRTEADAPVVYVALDAFAADGSVVGRLGVDGWTMDGLHTVGGRPMLPSASDASDASEMSTLPEVSAPSNLDMPISPPDASSTPWRRVSFAVAPTPPGTAWLRLEFHASGAAVGVYGLVDNVSLVPEPLDGAVAGPVLATDTYVPGPRPSIRTWLSPTTQRLRALTDPATAEGGRISMWLLGLDVAAARPVLGYGLGMEAEVARMYAHQSIRRTLQHFHSFYLRLLIEGGAVLLATVLVIIARLWRTFARAALARRPGALAASALLVALLVQSVFDPVLNFAGIVGGLWLVGAVCDTEAPAKPAARSNGA
ncbi:MAG: O-antigen ligase family protein [Trueperaceae bacterium]